MSERMSYDKLAKIIKVGFDQVDRRFDSVENRLTRLENGVENINLRLDNTAYRFELNELDQRVSVLEHKTGLVS